MGTGLTVNLMSVILFVISMYFFAYNDIDTSQSMILYAIYVRLITVASE